MPEASHGGMSAEEIEVFARGLHALASVDGITSRESALITDFLRQTGTAIALETLGKVPFSALEAAQTLEASWQRRLFVKTAVALVKADGCFSDAERRAIGEIADAFGLSNADFGQLEQDAARVRLE